MGTSQSDAQIPGYGNAESAIIPLQVEAMFHQHHKVWLLSVQLLLKSRLDTGGAVFWVTSVHDVNDRLRLITAALASDVLTVDIAY